MHTIYAQSRQQKQQNKIKNKIQLSQLTNRG
jgi:hypothetical protein